jgi:hypothetical protein
MASPGLRVGFTQPLAAVAACGRWADGYATHTAGLITPELFTRVQAEVGPLPPRTPHAHDTPFVLRSYVIIPLITEACARRKSIRVALRSPGYTTKV